MMSGPSFTYVSPNLLTTMRREMRRFLLHTYTRTPRIVIEDTGTGDPATDPGVNDWNQPVYDFGEPISGLPCFYEIREVPVITPQGLMTLNMPRLVLAFNDPLREGDHVSSIMTEPDPRTGIPTVLVAGPVIVESVRPQDPNLGGPVLIEATLREIQFLPSS